MSSEALAVRFDGVSKQYRRGGQRRPSVGDHWGQLKERATGRLRRQAAPTGTLALDDVSFDVAEGEAFALVGANGAGKTTALRILTRISRPTAGRVSVRGRIGALIEVGAGLHPELSGRENIWLYGTILGMLRSEIRRRFDDIVTFAELDEVLDRPLKYFSSGMQLRLGFSIASYLEPDILVVDEALAVGDIAFQAKCTKRMQDMLGEGRTLIYVSHSLSSVEELCRRGVLLDGGQVAAEGDVGEIVKAYVERVGK
jgi:ABC-type polysaccharide/polyol phosphate transport system ATPase subunit